MKRMLYLLLFTLACFSASGCGMPQAANLPDDGNPSVFRSSVNTSQDDALPASLGNDLEKDVAAMDYAAFLDSDGSEAVLIESCLQEKEVLEDGRTGLYLQDEDGAYYVSGLHCTAEDYEALTSGCRLRVLGYKTDFSGETQITDALISFPGGKEYVAQPADVTEYLGTEELRRYLNRRVCFRDLTVEAMFDGVSPFYYGWDNTGSPEQNSDLYFTASHDGEHYGFLIPAKLRDSSSDVYLAVQNLQAGDTVRVEGILTWYNGPQPLVTSVTVSSGTETES